MRGIVFLFLVGIALASVSFAAHTITQTFNGECPPDNEFDVTCWDLTGVMYVSTSVHSGETHSYSIPNSVETLVCIVECNGKEVFRKRYEFPGTRWKAVPGYPYAISRQGDLPAGTDVSDSTNVNVRNCDDCGNGNVDVGEKCDGSQGCDDPQKPACYECTYCGCNDAKQCVQISGSMECGTYGCAAYERPSFSVKCLDGICAYPRKCTLDPECIDKYQADRDKKVESTKQGYSISSGFMGAESQAFVSERFQGENPQVPVDDFGGTIAAMLPANSGETYTVNLISYDIEVGSVSGTALLMVNGDEHELGEGDSVQLDSQATLEVTAIDGSDVYFYIDTFTTDDLRIMLYTGDYDGDSGEITWPPAGKKDDEWYPVQEGSVPMPFGLQPGEKAHMECTSNGVCAGVRGEGLDECSYNPDGPAPECLEINKSGKHNECHGLTCTVVPGKGTDQCTKHEDCNKTGVTAGGTPGDGTTAPGALPEDADGRHGACSSAGYCIYAEGEGPDQCRSDGDCSEVTPVDTSNDGMHTACKDKRCIYVSGEGTDECAGHWNCDSSYPLPATKQMRCFGTMCRMESGEGYAGGRVCRTDMDCGGLGLFSSMLGTELEKGMEMGSPFRELLGNERINFFADGETAHVVLQDGVITDAGDGEMEGNTVNVRTDVQTIELIQMEETSLEEAIHEDKVRVEGDGFFEGIKFWFAKLFYDLFYTPTDVS